ncbi:hypothetical protein RRG08_012176 [Elysia crispata]|uniref:Uncharacterized protein n=1 Tax=Elysia crispata TaxID=231223 RepID=A0AAE0ZJ81_9GAST|nr:hypothetical protein RRG08_012176 [Elysia crispata]
MGIKLDEKMFLANIILPNPDEEKEWEIPFVQMATKATTYGKNKTLQPLLSTPRRQNAVCHEFYYFDNSVNATDILTKTGIQGLLHHDFGLKEMQPRKLFSYSD